MAKNKAPKKSGIPLAPNMDAKAFNKAEAAVREDDYQCYMILNDMQRRGHLDLLRQARIQLAKRDGDEVELQAIGDEFAEIEQRLIDRSNNCDAMLRAVAGR